MQLLLGAFLVHNLTTLMNTPVKEPKADTPAKMLQTVTAPTASKILRQKKINWTTLRSRMMKLHVEAIMQHQDFLISMYSVLV